MPVKLLMRLGLVLLAVFTGVGLAAPWVAPYSPTEQLDAVAGKHLPPLTVMAAIQLEHGQWRLADRVQRTAGGLTIERLGKTKHYAAAEVLNLDDDGVRDRRVFLLGSDKFGRDVFARSVHAARLDLQDEVVAGTLVTRDGEVVHPQVLERMGVASTPS